MVTYWRYVMDNLILMAE